MSVISLVDVRPFKAIKYTPKAGNPELLVTQPYDKIDTEMQEEYYKKSPYNYCRLILPTEADKYQIAQQRITQWLKANIMEQTAQSAIFVSRQEYIINGKKVARTGLIAALRLYPYNENIVFPHEFTHSAPKADRLNMLRTVQKNLEQVFLMYPDPENKTINFFKEIVKTTHLVKVTDPDGVEHTIWEVTDPEKIQYIQQTLSEKFMVINDGHHRYESALAYRDETRIKNNWTNDSAFNFHMCYMVPIQDEGLAILPTHRLLKEAKITPEIIEEFKHYFTVTDIAPNVDALDSYLAKHIKEHAFCVYDGKNAYGLTMKHEENVYQFVNTHTSKETKIFDVVILRDIIFKTILKTGELKIDENIIYIRWTKTAIEKINRGEAKVAFLVNPISAKAVSELALQHERLPEKSTDFYPKPLSGFMMMDVSVNEKL
ncbi:MAG: DUF1015 domain-containing protein [Nitrososphaerota archaeon]|jgi:uncharacterized protein (DUF1015 family)|nr:DUF1015 domain-containing protein [Nitrososphaerota archaeon]